jgi:flagellar basal body rod protein FlgG
MSGGAYVALSGLRARLEDFERVAADIANASTAGYKGERGATAAVERDGFARALQSAIDAAPSEPRIDFRPGSIAPTGRDLDLALEGPGFFAVRTPAGVRYTRNGHFARSVDGTLRTADGYPVEGEDGPLKIGTEGAVSVDPDGTVRTGSTVVGRLHLVDFDDYSTLRRESAGRFAAPGVAPAGRPAARVRSGALEESNASVVDRMASLINVSRSVESLQRGISMIMNDIDGKAISELGRR